MVRKAILLTLLSAFSFADTGFKDTIRVTETDLSPSCMAGQIKVSPGTLTCNGQTATITTGGGGGGGNVGFFLRDTSLNLWQVSINTAGALITTAASSATTGSTLRSSIVFQDSASSFWTLTVNTSGTLITTSAGSFPLNIRDILINDSTGFTWVVSVNTIGSLVTS